MRTSPPSLEMCGQERGERVVLSHTATTYILPEGTSRKSGNGRSSHPIQSISHTYHDPIKKNIVRQQGGIYFFARASWEVLTDEAWLIIKNR